MMKNRASNLTRMLSVTALVGMVAGCLPQDQVVGGSGGHQGSGGSGSGGNGSGGNGSGGNSGTGGFSYQPTSDKANFASVKDIIELSPCGGSGCHESGGTEPNIYGLNDDNKLYDTLMSYETKFCNKRKLVVPGNPDESALYLAVQGDSKASKCGTTVPQMPLGCIDNCVPDNYLEGLMQWIKAGAPKSAP